MTKKRKLLNVGSGMTDIPGWTNLDFDTEWYKNLHSNRRIDIHHNLMTLEPLPIENNEYHIVYSSHTIEHIPDQYVEHLVKEAYRILKRGGVLRITCPDIGKLYDAYMRQTPEDLELIASWKGNHTSPFRKHGVGSQFLFIFAAYLSTYHDSKAIPKLKETEIEAVFKTKDKEEALKYFTDWCAKHADELQTKFAGDHISAWYEEKLRHLMEDAGFKRIRTTKARGSLAPECNIPEFDTQKPDHSLYIEAIK